MPVVVTGASSSIGLALVRRLAGGGSQVRAHVRRPAAAGELRELGAKVAVGELADRDALATVVSEAHTVCHLVGNMQLEGPTDYEESNLQSARWVLEAAVDAEVRRFLLLSYTGADPSSSNAFLRAKGRAEEEVRASGLEHVILRTTFVYGTGTPWLRELIAAARRPVVTVVGPGTQLLRPVFVEDVAAVLAAADDRASETLGTFALEGPDEVTADELIDLVAGRSRRKVHLTPDAARRTAGLLGRRLSPAVLELFGADSVADAPDAAVEFSVSLTPLREGLRKAGLAPNDGPGRIATH